MTHQTRRKPRQEYSVNSQNPNKNRLVIATVKSTNFALLLGLLGGAAVTDVGLSREKDEVKVIAVVNTDQLDAGGLKGFSADLLVKLKIEDIATDGTIDSRLNPNKCSRIGTIERRNGFYAITGDKELAASPAFLNVMDQVKTKKAPAFDTAYAHTTGRKSTWIGKTGRNARLAHVDAIEITSARFGTLGLLLTLEQGKDVKTIDWASLAMWFDRQTGSNLPEYQEIYSGDTTIRSLSHVNGDRMVVNAGNGKTVLDLAALYEDEQAKVVSTDTSELASNLVGVYPGRTDMVSFVDEIQDDTAGTIGKIRFQPVAKLPRELRQDYAQAAA